MRNLFFLFFLLIASRCFSQDTVRCIDISKIGYVDTVRDQLLVAYLSTDSSLENNYQTLKFQPRRRFRSLPPEFVSKCVVGKFKLANRSDSVRSVYFFPG